MQTNTSDHIMDPTDTSAASANVANGMVAPARTMDMPALPQPVPTTKMVDLHHYIPGDSSITDVVAVRSLPSNLQDDQGAIDEKKKEITADRTRFNAKAREALEVHVLRSAHNHGLRTPISMAPINTYSDLVSAATHRTGPTTIHYEQPLIKALFQGTFNACLAHGGDRERLGKAIAAEIGLTFFPTTRTDAGWPQKLISIQIREMHNAIKKKVKTIRKQINKLQQHTAGLDERALVALGIVNATPAIAQRGFATPQGSTHDVGTVGVAAVTGQQSNGLVDTESTAASMNDNRRLEAQFGIIPEAPVPQQATGTASSMANNIAPRLSSIAVTPSTAAMGSTSNLPPAAAERSETNEAAVAAGTVARSAARPPQETNNASAASAASFETPRPNATVAAQATPRQDAPVMPTPSPHQVLADSNIRTSKEGGDDELPPEFTKEMEAEVERRKDGEKKNCKKSNAPKKVRTISEC